MLYRFDGFELDTETFELRAGGERCHVEPLVFDLIRYFVETAGQVVSRDDLIESVWRGRIVSDATVSSCIKSARRVLATAAPGAEYIKTVRGRGFSFVGSVSTDGVEVPAGLGVETPRSSIECDLPAVAVLPFNVLGDEGALGVIARGLEGTLRTVLTRVPLLHIVARTANATIDGDVRAPQDIGQRLGARYILDGSLQSVSKNIRVNVQLVETVNGFHLWAQTFEAPAANALDQLILEILPQLEAQLVRAMFRDLGATDGELTPRQLVLQATGLLSLKGWHRDTFCEAADLLRRAINGEPDLALAHGYLAIILGLGHRVGSLDQSPAVVDEAIGEAERALELDSGDSNVVGVAGCALADVGQPERAVPILKAAIEINGHNGQAWAALGSAYLILRRSGEAIEALEKSIQISPRDSRLAVWSSLLALGYMQQNNLEAALEAAERGSQSDHRSYIPLLVLAAVHLAKNDAALARRVKSQCYRAKPDLSEREVVSLIGRNLGQAFFRLES